MKKLILLMGAAIMALSSCSKSDNEDSVPVQLLKKTTRDDVVTIFTYDGSKRVKNETSGNTVTYAYTGDFVSAIDQTMGNSIYKRKFTYEDGRMKSMIYNESGTTVTPEITYEYTYETDGTVIEHGYSGEEPNGYTKLTYQNGNIVKDEYFDASGETVTTVNEYDTKNNPIKNTLGFDKLARYSKDNTVKSTITWGTSKIVVTNVYTYDDKGYPLTVQSTQIDSEEGYEPKPHKVVNITYEY